MAVQSGGGCAIGVGRTTKSREAAISLELMVHIGLETALIVAINVILAMSLPSPTLSSRRFSVKNAQQMVECSARDSVSL